MQFKLQVIFQSLKKIASKDIITVFSGNTLSFAKIVRKEHEEDVIRTRYQLFLEMKGGEPWLTGYWQDYNHKNHKKGQGRIYLKRAKTDKEKA